jgi:hypothetical protein
VGRKGMHETEWESQKTLWESGEVVAGKSGLRRDFSRVEEVAERGA